MYQVPQYVSLLPNRWLKMPEKQMYKSATSARLPFGQAYEAQYSCVLTDKKIVLST